MSTLTETLEKFDLQNAEFTALAELAKQLQAMPAIVDDDYPEARHRYEGALRSFMARAQANGRAFNSATAMPVERSIVHSWAAKLGLRHQGVLVSAIRGCDSVEREDPSKWLVRCFRGVLLRAHCGDVREAGSFMVPFDQETWDHTVADFLRSIDHYPNHWLLHFMHACEIVGRKHPNTGVSVAFLRLYHRLVKKFHLTPETEDQLDARLGADEKTFIKDQT